MTANCSASISGEAVWEKRPHIARAWRNNTRESGGMGKSRGAWGFRREVCCRGKRRNSYGLILPPPIRRGIIAKLGATDLELLGYRFSNALIRFSRSSIRSRIVPITTSFLIS